MLLDLGEMLILQQIQSRYDVTVGVLVLKMSKHLFFTTCLANVVGCLLAWLLCWLVFFSCFYFCLLLLFLVGVVILCAKK